MTVRDLITSATEQLSVAPVPSQTPYLDAVVLFGWAASIPKETVLASFPDRVTTLRPDTEERFHDALSRRSRGEPVAYIRGLREFYGLDFEVSPHTLVPRPETEVLVEAVIEAIKHHRKKNLHLHDCCTGSGCIGIAIAHAVDQHDGTPNQVTVSLSDRSPDALAVARHNS